MMTPTLQFALLVSAIAGMNSQSQCGGKPCPSGEDCIQVDGSFGCADPCVHYSALNDTWRSSNIKYKNKIHCDQHVQWKGWYRLFQQDSSVSMPESCVEKHMCGTHAPLWLAESHPKLEDGVAQRNVCGHWGNNCCQFKSKPIHVKACHGNFYVYKFVKPTWCSLAYCADVSSKICASCADNENCVRSKNSSWTCEAQEDVSRKICASCADNETCVRGKNSSWTCEAQEVYPKLHCGRKVLELGLLGTYLENKGLNASSAHLADRLCSARQQRNNMMWYQVERKAGKCGNTLTTNGTHAIYSNSLFVYPKNIEGKNFLPDPVSFPFSCIYPMDTVTSLDLAIRPQLRAINPVVGVGLQAQASMSLFRNSDFTGPYRAGPVTLPIGTTLYVGVAVDETETSRFVVVLDDCYTTHTKNHNDSARYFLIQNRCSTDRRQVSVAESGLSLRARFSAHLFLFQRDFRDVYLHCSLSLCDRSSSSCSPTCRARKPRSLSKALYLKPLTIGPIAWQSP